MVAYNRMIGNKIKERREYLNISQERLGEMIGVTYQQVQKYEKGTNKVSADRLFDISENLKVPIGYFFKDAERNHVAEECEDENYSFAEKLSLQEQEILNCFRSLPGKDAKSHLISFLTSVCRKKYLL